MIKGVIFDLDGVITDTAEFHYLAWKKLCDEEGLEFNKQINEELKGLSRVDSLGKILKRSKITFSESKIQECSKRKNRYYLQYLDALTPKDYLPGIKPLLESLKSSNYKIALGSASKNAKLVLGKLEATPFFDVIGDGNSVEKSKPAPDIFEFAATELGLKPEECLVIEDSASGINAAHNAGIKAVGIGSKDVLGVADLVLNSTELITLEAIQNI